MAVYCWCIKLLFIMQQPVVRATAPLAVLNYQMDLDVQW